MATLELGGAKRDKDAQRDSFTITAIDFDLTVYGDLCSRRVFEDYTPNPHDTQPLQLLLNLLVGAPGSTQKQCTHVTEVTQLTERHLRVTGTWLNVGLLKHWIVEAFKDVSYDMQVIDESTVTSDSPIGQLVSV